jgi:hypothetical protein
MEVQTRQNKKGDWWCNMTAQGYGDISFEGKTIEDAQNGVSRNIISTKNQSQNLKLI